MNVPDPTTADAGRPDLPVTVRHHIGGEWSEPLGAQRPGPIDVASALVVAADRPRGLLEDTALNASPPVIEIRSAYTWSSAATSS